MCVCVFGLFLLFHFCIYPTLGYLSPLDLWFGVFHYTGEVAILNTVQGYEISML